MVARRIGRRIPRGAEAAVQGIALGLIVAVVTGAMGVASRRVCSPSWARARVLTIGSTYARIMLAGTL